jgi:DNA-binding transcriptional MerR regulator
MVRVAVHAADEGFRGPQVCKIVGITYRQLDYWARTELLKPSISDARGSGTQRVYSYTDLLKLKVIKQLLDEGMSLQKARSAIQALESSGTDVAAANLVLNGADSLLISDDGQLLDLLKGGQGVLVFSLAGVVEELEAAIHEFRPVVEAGGVEDIAPAAPKAGTGG